jgi:plasmid maintenance system antidote protein VapI
LGNACLPIFEYEHDRHRVFVILQEVLKRFNWLCHAYCLMENHYHLEDGETREERNEAILSAHLEYGYSLSEIARHLGLHYTTISKIVKEGLS